MGCKRFTVKAIDLGDLSTFMVATQQSNLVRISGLNINHLQAYNETTAILPCFQNHEQSKGFQAEIATVNKIPLHTVYEPLFL